MMARYTIHDLMLMAGVHEGEPNKAVRLVDGEAVSFYEEQPFLPDMVIDAEDGEEFNLQYDDGKEFKTVIVTIGA
jgi:hypothetical protein